jgi:DNA repair exonuclease SbcCD ATPase subunit
MILRRLRVEGFGALQGEWSFDPARINLFCGENERGKTTLAAAITAALFGLESDKRAYRDGRATPYDHYKPWSGRPYALELELDVRGKRYLINRHFGNNRLTVLEDGKDVTEDFRHGSGEYKVGEELLGLAGPEQFARTSLALQPGPTRLGGDEVRPDSSLTALLEGMASSVTGDASSANAIRLLDEALKSYKGRAQTGMIVNEIKKLEVALGATASDLSAAESDRAKLAESLARLADLEDHETHTTEALATARRAAARRRQGELTAALERDEKDRAQIAQWREELARLEPARAFPKDAAQRLSQAHAERDAAQRTLNALAQDRQQDLGAPRLEIETTLATCSQFGWAEPGHIEELAGIEKDLDRVREQVRTAAGKRAELERDLAARGVSLERVGELTRRFGGLTGDDKTLLMQYPAQTQAIVVEGETAHRAATGASAVIDQVSAARARLRGFGLTAGVIGLIAGGVSVWLAIGAHVVESFVGLGATLIALAAAIVLLLRSASHRADERGEALRQMLDAQRRLTDLKTRRREREEMLEQLSARLEFADVTSLLREHGEHLRLTTEGQRMGWLEEDAARSAEAEAHATAAVRAWAAKADMTADGPAHETLARLRQGIGAVLEARARARELDQVERRILAQEDEATRRLTAARAEIVDVARVLGLDQGASDAAALTNRVEARAKEHARLEALEQDLLPALEARTLSAETRAAHEKEVARLAADAPTGEPEPEDDASATADPAALERELTGMRRERLELVAKVGGRERDTSDRIAKLIGERDLFQEALVRAKRFKEAVELARDRFQVVARETHARWSESLSGRVDELLTRFGLQHQSFQISEKLDLSLSLGGDRLTQSRLDQTLSAGARDQLQLALRIAICEYLARGGEKLPLLLDDPLASSDEDRTRRLFQTLSEAVRTGHQVLVLTCHRAKIEAAKSMDPAWFADSVAFTELAPETVRRNP